MKATKQGRAGGNVASIVAATERSPGVFDLQSVLQLLYARSQEHLTRAELRWIAADGAALAEHISRHAADVVERIGCLVSADGSNTGAGTGYFQSHDDVCGLLFHVSQTLLQVAGLVEISADAAAELMNGGAE